MLKKIKLLREAETILNSAYKGDSIVSVMNKDETIKLCNNLTMLQKSAGMHPRKCISNSSKVME